MNRFIFLFAVLSSAPACAETQPRCGTDAFGNAVCMDKDGVLTNAPKKPATGRPGGADRGEAASAVAPDEHDSANGDWSNGSRRCGTDPFGNFVCRQ